jgi:hypothetical protein
MGSAVAAVGGFVKDHGKQILDFAKGAKGNYDQQAAEKAKAQGAIDAAPDQGMFLNNQNEPIHKIDDSKAISDPSVMRAVASQAGLGGSGQSAPAQPAPAKEDGSEDVDAYQARVFGNGPLAAGA